MVFVSASDLPPPQYFYMLLFRGLKHLLYFQVHASAHLGIYGLHLCDLLHKPAMTDLGKVEFAWFAEEVFVVEDEGVGQAEVGEGFGGL